jgi:hypothetical protein
LAEAYRLAGRAETLLAPGIPARGKVAILMPGSSALWDNNSLRKFYEDECHGLYYALSHAFGEPADFVDEVDVAAGVLTGRDYWALYVPGPNVSAAAQSLIAQWISNFGSHPRTLVVMPGAATADEYNSPTTTFDQLAGLTDRLAVRKPSDSSKLTASILLASPDFNAAGQKLDLKGYVADLQLDPNSMPIADILYDGDPNRVAMATRTFVSGKLTNRVSSLGFYPGMQYLSSPERSHWRHLPQDWSVVARELSVLPVVRMAIPRSISLSGPLGVGGQTLNEQLVHLTQLPIETLRLDSEHGTAVVLINWSEQPIAKLHVRVDCPKPKQARLASGHLMTQTYTGGSIAIDLPLLDVDILLLSD